MGRTRRTGLPPVGGLSFHGVPGLCSNSLAHRLPGGIEAQGKIRPPMQAWVSFSGALLVIRAPWVAWHGDFHTGRVCQSEVSVAADSANFPMSRKETWQSAGSSGVSLSAGDSCTIAWRVPRGVLDGAKVLFGAGYTSQELCDWRTLASRTRWPVADRRYPHSDPWKKVLGLLASCWHS